MGSVSIDRRRPQDQASIDALYLAVFGQSLAAGSRRRWKWQYEENPETRGTGPDIWVARDGEEILGQYASMPVRLWWGQEEVRASWGMDVFVSASARGRGVGQRLFTAWAEHVDVALGLGLTPSSYGLFRKLGYWDVGPVPFYRAWLDPGAVAARRFGRAVGGILGGLAGPWLRPARRRPLSPDVSVRAIPSFGAEYDDLWARTRASYAMCAGRGADYLRWKYVNCPHRGYDLWEAQREGRLVGFAVSRHEDYRGLRLGWVVDLYADASDHGARRALLAAILDSFQASGVARAQAFAMSRAVSADLRRMGFFRGPSPMQFCVQAKAAVPAACRDLGRWHVVFGDSDMDR